MKIKIYAALIVCAALLLSGCGGTAMDDAQTSVTSDAVASDASFTVAGSDISLYRIVRADICTDSVTNTAIALRHGISDALGVELPLVTDWEEETPYEIVVGKTTRAGSSEECGWRVEDGRIFIGGADGADLSAVCEIFASDIASKSSLSDGDGENFSYVYNKYYTNGEPVMKTDYNELSYFSWGVNGHNRAYAAYPEAALEGQIETAARLGAKLYRFNFNPVTEADFTYTERVVKLCEKYGMSLMLVLDDMSGTPDEIYSRQLEMAKRFAGRIEYYQLFNETDVYAMHTDDGSLYHDGDGSTLADYAPARVKELTEKMLSSQKALREGDKNAKLVINFAWKHTALLKAYEDAGVEWDVTGIDWYSDMEGAAGIDYITGALDAMFPAKPYIICECNIWAHNSYTEREQADYMRSFADKVYVIARQNSNFTGMIVYELLDELNYEGDSYNGEAHFGLVNCTSSGKIGEIKLAYSALRDMWAGGEFDFKAERAGK